MTALRTFTSLVCIAAILAAPLARPAAAELTRSGYDECAARDEAGLGAALTAISADALKTGIGKLDYNALVREAWHRNNVDEVIDKRVDIAVEEIKAETSWSELLSSLANSETSQKLATAVAERVYRSDAVKGALEALAQDVSKEVGKSMEGAASDAAGPVLSCLKAFIGPRYGSAVASAVAGDAGRDIALDPATGTGQPTAGAVIKQSGEGIAGVTILIVRRQLANLAARVGQRVVGSVLSRLVSVAAGGIGLVLIAKDIWEFRNGVLPIIAAEMKSQTTKEKVQDEIASSISEQINAHVQDIAAASANRIMEIWKEFKRSHAIVLRLAENDGEFRGFLDGVAPSAMARLDEIVGLVVAEEGEASVKARLDNGTLNEAVHIMPQDAVLIARETRSLDQALRWTAVAGDKLGSVVGYDIYKRAKAEDFTRQSLERILGLEDRSAIIRMSQVSPKARDALFSLPDNELKVLARTLSSEELTTLASYLTGLEAGPRERVLRAIALSPSKMQVLARERVRDAIIASPDQSEAVSMMLETSTTFAPRVFAHDVKLAAEGKVEPILLWDKHPVGIGLLGFLSAIVLIWLGRLFRRPRPAPTPPSSTDA
ncbi:MAG: hypothetical protein R3D51_02595 [Hyphomicrobiaceae bacterium]